jgi:hypothetical protein
MAFNNGAVYLYSLYLVMSGFEPCPEYLNQTNISNLLYFKNVSHPSREFHKLDA